MTYSNTLHTHYLDLARAPIVEGHFGGDDVRYSPDFESLETELAKTLAVHEAGAVDWERVCVGCERILGQQSKDLRVAAWLAWSLYQRQSFTGLHAGLSLVQLLCQEHWPALFPRKSRTRTAALNWLVPRLEKAFSDEVPISAQLPLFRSLAEVLRSLESCLSQHLGSEAPLLLPLCRRLDGLVSRATQGETEPGKLETARAQVKHSATQMLGTPGPIDNDKDAHKTLRSLQDANRPLCAWWLKQKATDLKPLRLARTLLWLPIDSLPDRNAEQVTALRGLPADKLNSFHERFQQGRYADLLLEIESSVARAPFWLDGQRLAWECLQALDASQAMREVEIQLALFLQRVPGIEALQFHDGIPFADAATRRWISAQVLPHLHPHETAEPQQPPAGTQAAWDSALQTALTQLRKDGLKAGVQQLKHGLSQAQGGRQRFFWQLALARLCVAAKKYELAKSQLEALDQLLQSSGLSQWEPELALETLHLLHHCYELLPQSARDGKDEIHRRLCHLDLERVLD